MKPSALQKKVRPNSEADAIEQGALIKRAIFKIAEVLCNKIASTILIILVLLIVADVILRYFFGKGIPGSYELTEYMFGLIVFLGLAYTQIEGRHVFVDLVIKRFPPRMRKILGFLSQILVTLLLMVIGCETILRAVTCWRRHEVSGVLGIPLAPFIFAAAIGILVLSLTILVGLIKNSTERT